jgi:hypothetical protein
MQKQPVQNTLSALVFLLFAAFLLPGCGVSHKYGVAKINSTPSGAEIINLKDSTNLGSTPAQVMFKGEADTSELVTIQLRKVGYADRIATFWINRRHPTVDQAEQGAIDIHVELEKQKQ